jgi:hypothetical protein
MQPPRLFGLLASKHSSLVRSLSVQPRRNIHRSQLLEKQLGRIRDVDLGDLVLVVACLAFERVLLQFAR